MITRYLHQHPRILLLLLLVIVMFGFSSFLVMPRLEDPLLSQRVAVISTIFSGAEPARAESTVTIPIEQILEGNRNIKQVRSNTRTSISNVVIELADEISDVDKVWASIENDLKALSDQLPDGCEPPQLTVFPLRAFASILAVTPALSDESSIPELRKIASELRSRILKIDGTEQVELFGDPGLELAVEVEPAFLANTGMTTGQIANQILKRQASASGSAETTNGSRLLLDVRDAQTPLQGIESTYIDYAPSHEPVRLDEIASVQIQPVNPPATKAIAANKPAVVLGVMVDPSHRIDLWNHNLADELATFQSQLPNSCEIETLFSQSDHIQQRMQGLLRSLALSTLAVVIAVMLMMGWRCMLVVAVALPLSAMLVLFGLRVMSIPIHQMSITGLTVALGLLIDNAIVMVEEVRSRIASDKTRVAATHAAIRHLRVPLFGSTLTTVLAFLPIATMPGPSGEFVGTIAVSVILAVSASFLLSITVIPPLVSLVGVDDGKTGITESGLRVGWVESIYLGSLKFVFRWPLMGVILGIILPVAGFVSFRSIPRQFFPATDRSQLQIEVELPAASELAVVEECVDRIQQIVAQDGRVERQSWFLGNSAPTFYYNVVPRRRGVTSYAQAFVDIEATHDVAVVTGELQSALDARIFDARVVVQQLQQGPPYDAPIEIRVLGPDLAVLRSLGTQIREQLANFQDVNHTRSDLEDTALKWSFAPEPDALKNTRLDKQTVSQFLYACTNGAPAGTIFQDEEEIPVRVQVDFGNRTAMEVLPGLPIPARQRPNSARANNSGSPTRLPTSNLSTGRGVAQPASTTISPLGSLGPFTLDSDVAAIIRWDGQRANEVKAYLKPNVLPANVLDDFKVRLASSDFNLPEGYELQIGGENEKRTEAVGTLLANAIVLFSIMLLVLVAVTGSFRLAFVVASVGGLAIGLGPLALYLFAFPFGFMAIVGTMGLVGVAINDSIVVLAAISANEKLPLEQQQTLPDVVLGCTRHILATTLTTIVGFLPLVIDGGKFWPPLAIVIAAGVGGATLLALYFTPSLYRLVQSPQRYR